MMLSRMLLAFVLAGAVSAGLVAPTWAAWSAVGPEQTVNSTSVANNSDMFPRTAMAPDGRSVVVWTRITGVDRSTLNNVYARWFAADGTPLGGEVKITTAGANHQSEPAAAMAADGRSVIAWMVNGQDGSGWGVYAQRYAADATPLGGPFLVNSTVQSDQMDPSVAMSADGRFVIGWTGALQGGCILSVFAQRYAADGSREGGEFHVPSTSICDQYNPKVGMTPDGRFIIAWEGDGETDDAGVNVRRFAADGTPLGAEFRANTTTPEIQGYASLAVAADGRFVVAWQSPGQDGSEEGIYARRYAADGTPQGGEFPVNTTSQSYQWRPAASITADGRAVIAWMSWQQDGDAWGVYAQRYDSDGSPKGGELLVNATTAGFQTDPALAMSGDGRMVAVWMTDTRGRDEVVARRYLWSQPVAQNDTFTLSGSSVTVPPFGVLQNDTSLDGSAMTARVVFGPSVGALTFNPNGSFSYAPTAGFKGTDQFGYVASDGIDTSSPAVVTISGYITACVPRPRVQTAPVAGGGQLSVTVSATPMNGAVPNALARLEFGTLQNARVTLGGQPITTGQVVTLAPNTPSVAFSVQRATPGQPTTVPFTVVDGCGSWQTFVGGGAGASF